MDLNVVLPTGSDDQPQRSTDQESTSRNKFIDESKLGEIARVFSNFSDESRVTIIPIGFPRAGKSLLLSSLFWYARNGADPTFNVKIETSFPFNNGNKAQDLMTRYFDKGKIYGTTQVGTLDLVGVTIRPTHKKLHELDLAILDLAGEDIEKIKTSNTGDFTAKINAIFNGLQVTAAPVIFLLITPFKHGRLGDYLGEADEHQKEDQLLFDFINYLEVNQPRLFENSKFVVLVSKWDMNSDPKMTVEDFILKYRPSLYRSIMTSNVSMGHYSIGRILTQQEEAGSNNVFEAIVEKNQDSPSRLWRRLYTICTGDNLDRKSFWQRLLS